MAFAGWDNKKMKFKKLLQNYEPIMGSHTVKSHRYKWVFYCQMFSHCTRDQAPVFNYSSVPMYNEIVYEIIDNITGGLFYAI